MADNQSKNFIISESHYRSRGWLTSINNELKVSLISSMRSERSFYKKKNIKFEKLFLLDEFLKKNSTPHFTLRKKVIEFEKKNKITISEFVATDRKLKRFKNEDIINYAGKLIIFYSNILSKNKFKFCFMEITWFHEIILYHICRNFSLKVYCPERCKLSFNKFFIFTDFGRSNFLKLNTKPDLSFNEIYKEIHSHLPFKGFKNRKIEKEFIKLKNRNSINIDKFIVLYRLIVRKIEGGYFSYIHMGLIWYIKYKIKCIVRKKIYSFFYRFDKVDFKKIKYVYIPLHVQPEAGIDLVGRKYSNQIDFIKKCSLTLPANYHIIVKDHPHDFGRKKSFFYKEIQSIYNCKVVHPKVLVQEIIANASLVITIVGTTSLEAALMGTPSLTAIEMYYSKLLIQNIFNPNIDRIDQILLNTDKWKEFRRSRVFNMIVYEIYRNRFNGNIGPIDVNNSVLDKQNLNKVNYMFRYLLNEKN